MMLFGFKSAFGSGRSSGFEASSSSATQWATLRSSLTKTEEAEALMKMDRSSA